MSCSPCSTKDESATKDEVRALRAQVESVSSEASEAAEDDVASLTDQLDALEGGVNTIAGGQRTTESEISVVQDDIDDLRDDINELETATTTPSRRRRRRQRRQLARPLAAHPPTLGGRLTSAPDRAGHRPPSASCSLELIDRGADLVEPLSDGTAGSTAISSSRRRRVGCLLGLVHILHRVDDDREQDVDHQERGEQDVGDEEDPRRRVDLLARARGSRASSRA